ncbi:MAG: indolepyruvate ferredoxin oxidoreductase family protein [Bryobacterales bacterium]|nr:indolepyruvate ferredoxin oxidoreductase family protein [Bryobacterales bacterium]
MTLDDKYTLDRGAVYLTGIQALVRLPLDQMRLDARNGLRTGCYITGYEGSPLGGYDFALARARKHFAAHNIHFQPAINEDIAATAVFGSQIFATLGDRAPTKVDGVVGIWYGKGPGVDRSGDVLRHANLCGSPGLSAALVLAGDDHPCKSSSIPHQSDLSLYNVNIPILFPGNTQEILDYGLYAIALSRFSGAWCSLKLLTQTCDGGGTATIDLDKHRFHIPDGYSKHTDPRLVPGIALNLEYETNVRRIPAVLEFAKLNPINRWHGAGSGARVGIATAGKYYYDLMQALSDAGIAGRDLERLGIRIAKFGMTYPLEPGFVDQFASGLDRIFVVEEKRSFLELQLREALYNRDHRPRIFGKQDEHGETLLRPTSELDPDLIMRALTHAFPDVPEFQARSEWLDQIHRRPKELTVVRTPNYCSGCPHNRSTLVLPGQVAGGGIGCHGMGFLMEDAGRGYSFATQMGGEGAPWFGMAPFVDRAHIFQNIGDGTYFHSGQLAIQAAVSAGVNITYKILYNGHVAMTGGQDAVGALPIPQLTRKLEAEGVRKIIILTEDVTRYPDPGALSRNSVVRDRIELVETLAELEKTPGVSVLIYDQECAAEKRRLRSRGKYEEPTQRMVIHEEVCEGCGDCLTESNCMSLQRVNTAQGEKMQIHQSSCNKDYTCALGDCPSFVSVEIKKGSGLKKAAGEALPDLTGIPAPQHSVDVSHGYRLLAPGIGGTGVVTINAILATAATNDGLSVISLDQTGLAQKGGAVVSHLVLSRQPLAASARINAGNADLILGFDLLGVLNPDNLKCASEDRTAAVLNTRLVPTAESIRKRLPLGDEAHQIARVDRHTRRGYNVYLDATSLSERLFGTHMMSNMIVLGAAWQAGLVPISLSSIEEAIRLNGVDVDRNLTAFGVGRYHYLHPVAAPPAKQHEPIDYTAALTAYQDAAYARRHSDFVEYVRQQRPELAATVALHLFRLMRVKDEYEVARLLTSHEFKQKLDDEWEAVESYSFLLHPPLLRRLGWKRKITIPGRRQWLLKLLASLKTVRFSALDLFGYTKHRKLERELVAWYRNLVETAIKIPDIRTARQLCETPDLIRGYERIKETNIARARKQADDILESQRLTPVETR